MGWSFEQMVSYASRASWVKAGEVLASGTCAGGALAETWGRTGSLLPPPLQVGDVVQMTIERLGTIRNEIVASTEQVPAIPPPVAGPARRSDACVRAVTTVDPATGSALAAYDPLGEAEIDADLGARARGVRRVGGGPGG